MNNEIKIEKGDFVTFYDAGYEGRYINEDGDMDIWDWHLYSSGHVLATYKESVLVLLYSKLDENSPSPEKIILNEIHAKWIDQSYLSKRKAKVTIKLPVLIDNSNDNSFTNEPDLLPGDYDSFTDGLFDIDPSLEPLDYDSEEGRKQFEHERDAIHYWNDGGRSDEEE